MKIVRPLILALASLAPALAAAAELVASPWVDLREARIRLLVERSPDSAAPMRGALEIRMIDGYKTYWRNAGDSGVPPNLDFSKTAWLGKVDVRFPFPGRFDDGAGGTAFGYVGSAMLPFEAERIAKANSPLHLKLDFAVCGTMCIPLSGDIAVNLAKAAPASADSVVALTAARSRVPVILSGQDARALADIKRESDTDGKPRWSLRVAKDFNAANFHVFPEGQTFLQPGKTKQEADGRLRVVLTGDPPPGFSGQFGKVSVTLGDGARAFEIAIDLDAGVVAP